MSLIQQFPNGVNNVAYGATRAFIGVPDYIPVIEYCDDFVGFSDILATSPTSHTVTNASSATLVQTAGVYGGVVTITGASTATDFISVQTKTSPFAPVVASAVHPFTIRTRFEVNTIASCNVIIGLCDMTATPFTSITDGIYFQSNAGVLTFNIVAAAGSSTILSLPSMANATYVSLGARYNSDTSSIDVLVNESVVASTVVISNLTAVALAPTIALKAVTSAANILTVDYIDICQVR